MKIDTDDIPEWMSSLFCGLLVIVAISLGATYIATSILWENAKATVYISEHQKLP